MMTANETAIFKSHFAKWGIPAERFCHAGKSLFSASLIFGAWDVLWIFFALSNTPKVVSNSGEKILMTTARPFCDANCVKIRQKKLQTQKTIGNKLRGGHIRKVFH